MWGACVAVPALENVLAQGHLDSTVVGNLCECVRVTAEMIARARVCVGTLYDLASDKSADKKKVLLSFVRMFVDNR
jgi:hypothetical protein